MKMQPVESSNIGAIGYHHGTLEVHFKNGTRYQYKGVPIDLHDRMLKAESVGRFFSEHIRSGDFTVERMADEGQAVRRIEASHHPAK